MRLTLLIIAAIAFSGVFYAFAERCEPGSKGVKIAGVMLISGCD